MSDDLLNQHAAISDLQQSEEVLVDHHKAMNEFLMRFLPESKDLYSQTNYVAYDQDGEFNFSVFKISRSLEYFSLYAHSIL